MARFLYYVAPLTRDKWNILFEDQRRPFIYDSEEDALKAARKAVNCGPSAPCRSRRCRPSETESV